MLFKSFNLAISPSQPSQIAENIEAAEKQRNESDQKLKDYEKIINNAKIEAKNIFNQAREKILRDINNKKKGLEKKIDEEIEIVGIRVDKYNTYFAEGYLVHD